MMAGVETLEAPSPTPPEQVGSAPLANETPPQTAGVAGGQLGSVATPVRVNLLPVSVRVQYIARRRGRAWMLVGAVMCGLLGLGWQWASGFAARAATVRAALVEARERVQQKKKLGTALAMRSVDLRKQLRTFEAMRAQTSWAVNLAALADAVPAEAVLTRVEVQSRNDRAPADNARRRPRRGAAAQKQAEAAAPSGIGVQITGYAADHHALAALLRRLEQSRCFQGVKLLSSVSEPLGAGIAMRFEVSCRTRENTVRE